ncbi:hypothetical protein [Serinibacter arcticus]|uniref:ribonuclease HII n=1 Tax=Serinibacter arcticus TaxID=1655435 RepID=UPI0026CD33F1
MTVGRAPTLRLERELAVAPGSLVAGMDEVGRGCLAGPVSVGVTVVDATSGRQPAGLRDSKLLAPAARERLLPPIRRWALACAVGHASPAEIDAIGIIAALRLAGHRAVAEVTRALGRRPPSSSWTATTTGTPRRATTCSRPSRPTPATSARGPASSPGSRPT